MAHLAVRSIIRRRTPGRHRLAALAAVLLVALVAVAPASAAPSPSIELSSPDFWPGSATTSTSVTFRVTYRHTGGLAPSFVRVHVGGTTGEMQVAAGSNWKQGVVFEVTTRLPAGTWVPWFEAQRGDLYATVTMSRSITVSGPTPTPTPTPRPTPSPAPTPKPTPTATPRPTPTATPKPTPKPTPAATPKPTPKPTSKPGPSATDAPTATPKASSGGKSTPKPSRSPSTTASPDTSPEPTPTRDPGLAAILPGAASSGPGGVGGTNGRPGGGPVNDSDPPLAGSLGGVSSGPSILPMIAAAVGIAGGLTMLVAFLMFGRRRQDAEGPDEASLAASAAAGYPLLSAPRRAQAGGLSPLAAGSAAAVSTVQAIADMAVVQDREADVPRWRRASLIEARKKDPIRGGAAASAILRFDGRAGEAVEGLERRRIRYRLVSLLNLPDEVKGVEIGSLDHGDEVVLLEKAGTYWRVLCPDGREGWLHKMTLGDTVIDSPSAPGTWTSADDGPAQGGFEDIMRAYNESRRQFGEI